MWWNDSVFYEVYMLSFSDSNGDGIGDFRGLASELPYLASLGIDALWLTPFYASPFVDNGYDVADYCSVDARFGTMEDFERFIKEARSHGIRVVIDMVLNHTSVEHPWFVESSSSRESARRDWYVWRDEPPNNWESYFGGTAWQKHDASNQYYFHAFAPEMADLNWDSPGVKEAVRGILRFWLSKGVSGFRLDVINMLKCGTQWDRDNPVSSDGVQLHVYDKDSSGAPAGIQWIRDSCEGFPEVFLMGEVASEDPDVLARYARDTALDAVFGFNVGSIPSLDFVKIGEGLAANARLFGAVPGRISLCFSSHDISRFHTRLSWKDEQISKGLAAVLLTAPSIPLLYQGDELAIGDYMPRNSDDFRDVQAVNAVRSARQRGEPESRVMEVGLKSTRDWSRTLCFSAVPRNRLANVQSFLPRADPPYGETLRARQIRESDSMYSWIRDIILLRRTHQALREGLFRLLKYSPELIVYARESDREIWFIAVNNGSREEKISDCGVMADLIVSSLRPSAPGCLSGLVTVVRPKETLLIRSVRLRDHSPSMHQGALT